MSNIIRTYPHPVLRPDSDDFIGVDFSIQCDSPILLNNTYSLKFTVTNTCPEMKKLIKDGKAVYAVRTSCKATMYRETQTFSDEIYTVEIPRDAVLGDVTLSPMIVSLEDIDNYSCKAFHPDYKGSIVSISAGDILAVAEPIYFDAQQQHEIDKTPESIFRFIKERDMEKPPVTVLASEYIYIRLREDIWQKVSTLTTIYEKSPGKATILWSLFIIPALTEILTTWFSDERLTKYQAESKSYSWFRVLRDKLESLGLLVVDKESGDIDLDTLNSDISVHPLEYAERLIENPVISSLDTLCAMEMTCDGGELI